MNRIRTVLPALGFLALTGIAGCSGQSAETHYQQARQAYDRGDRGAAAIGLKNALQENPEYPEARYLLGVVYNDTGAWASAEKELRKARSLGFDRARVDPALGRAMLMEGMYQELLEQVQVLPELPKDVQAGIHALRGNAYLGLRKVDEARASFDEGARLAPEHAQVLLGQARLKLLDRDIDGALALIDRALAADRKATDAWLTRGDLLRLKGQHEEAIAAYSEVLAYDADNLPARMTRAVTHLGLGRPEKAQEDVDALRGKHRNHPLASYLQALIDFRAQKFQAAADALALVLKASPNYPPALLLAGATQYALGSLEQAEEYLNASLRLAPESAYARKLLAGTMLKKGDPKRALEVLEPVLAKGGEDPDLLALAADANMKAGNFAKATEFLEKAASADPKNAALRTGLGLTRLATGQGDRAVAELEAASRMDADKFQADFLLAMTHLSRKEYDKAMEAVVALEKKQPDNPVTHNLKGAVLLGKRDEAGAGRAFGKAVALEPGYFPAVVNLAQLDMRAKKPEAARARFEALLELEPKNVQAMLALAQLAATQRKVGEYVQWLERARQVDAAALAPRALLARHYLQSGEAQKALAVASEAGNAHPGNPEALDVLGAARMAAGDRASALSTYTKLVSVVPDSPLAHYRLAGVQAAGFDLAGAEASLRRALELAPNYLDAKVSLVALRLRAGQHDEALALAGEITKAHPKIPLGHVAEGDVLMAAGKPAQAVAAYEAALALTKSGTLVGKVHAAKVAAGKTREADAALEKWIREHPDDRAALLYRAEHLLKSGSHAESIAQYEKLLKDAPDNIIILNNLAWLYQQEKDPRALDTAERAYKLSPGSPAVADTLGWVLVERGDLERGTGLLQQAASRAPDSMEIRFHLALAWVKAGDKARARRELQALLDTGKPFPQVEEARALLRQL